MWTHASHYIPQTTAAWESSPRLPTWQTAVSREYPVSKPQHAGKPSSLESSWTSPSCPGHRHVYLIQPTGLKYNVSERSMLAVSGDHQWRTLALSFQNLLCGLWAIWLHLACQGWLLYFLLFPFDSVKPVPHHPTTIQCLVYYACHVLTHLGLLLSHFPQHSTEMPSSSHSSSFGPVFKAQFSPAS